jgi:hypothetical protein
MAASSVKETESITKLSLPKPPGLLASMVMLPNDKGLDGAVLHKFFQKIKKEGTSPFLVGVRHSFLPFSGELCKDMDLGHA